MNWEHRIERLASRAQADRPPKVDVAQSVLQMLTAGQVEPLSVAERFWMWLAAVSSAIAVPAAAVAFMLYARSAGPLSGIVEAISWATK
jgi:hypothetical protein